MQEALFFYAKNRIGIFGREELILFCDFWLSFNDMLFCYGIQMCSLFEQIWYFCIICVIDGLFKTLTGSASEKVKSLKRRRRAGFSGGDFRTHNMI